MNAVNPVESHFESPRLLHPALRPNSRRPDHRQHPIRTAAGKALALLTLLACLGALPDGRCLGADLDVVQLGSRLTPGVAWNVAVSGNHAFIANNTSGLAVIDVSDPAAPQLVTTFDTPGNAYDVTVVGSYAYVADGTSGLQIIDISVPGTPTLAGTLDTSGTARGITVAGGYAYVADNDAGLRIINVSNPAAPSLVGTYNTPGLAWSVSVQGNTAFVADATAGLQVINVSVPATPTLTGSYNTPGYTLAVEIAGNRAYVADGDAGLEIFDITTPATPVLLGSYDTPGYAYDVALIGSYACVADYGGHFQVLDVQNPAAPNRIGGHHTTGNCLGVVVSGGRAFVADEGAGLKIMEVGGALSANPQRLSAIDLPGFANGIAISGNHAYLATEATGLQIVDLTNPALPTIAGSNSVAGLSYGVALKANYAFVAAWTTGLEVIDVTNPLVSTRVGGYDTSGRAYGVAITGNYACVADDTGGLKIIDISTPSAPNQVGSYATPGRAYGVAVDGTRVFVADRSGVLLILDISNPAAPSLLASHSTVVPAFGVALRGKYACVAVGQRGLEIVDVSNPTNPQSVGLCSTGGFAYGVATAGRYAYVADWGSGVQIIDLSNPAHPQRVGGNASRSTFAVASSGSRIVTASGFEGMSVLDPFTPANSSPQLDLLFGQAISLPTGPSPSTVTAGDYDADGRLDVALAYADDGSVQIWRNTSAGSGIGLSSATLLATSATSSRAIQSADLNGDGKTDLAVLTGSPGTAVLKVFANTTAAAGLLTFATPADLTTTPESTDLAIADFDHDGLPDLVVAEPATASVAVLRNISSGGTLAFASPQRLNLAFSPSTLTVGDLDADGNVDLVTAQPGTGSLGLLRNASIGPGVIAFEPAFTLPTAAGAAGPVVGDLDGDGRLDLIVPDGTAPSLSLFRNASSPGTLSVSSFGPRVTVPAEWGTKRLTLADYNRDGRPDLIIAATRANQLAVLRNQASPGALSGTDFASATVLPTGDAPGQPLGIDLDRDGRADLLTANAWDNTLSIFPGQASLYAPLGSPALDLSFSISDAETPSSSLAVSASVSKPLLAAVGIAGTGANRTLQVTPLPGAAGVVTVTVTLDDGAGGITIQDLVVYLGCPDNTTWPRACELALLPPNGAVRSASVRQALESLDEARWYRFAVEPGSRAIITLTGLTQDYDLFVFRDIQAAYDEILSPTTEDLVRLGAEFAPTAFSPTAFSDDALAPTAFSPTAFSPTAFSPTAFSPTAFSPTAFSPTAFSPTAFSPTAFSPTAFSPTAFSPTAFSPTAFSPTAFSPTAFSPTAFSPTAFSPTAFSPTAFSPTAFSGAQLRSLLAVSAFSGTAGEGVLLNTWDHTGDFYICVRGRNGAFDPLTPYLLQTTLLTGGCSDVVPLGALPPSNTTIPSSGDFTTLIVTDPTRMVGSTQEKVSLAEALAGFAARPEIRGAILDVGLDARVLAANLQADAHPDCVFARNQVAEAIRQLVVGFRNQHPDLAYVVIVGNDDVIPFFRHPDMAGLGSERNYVPPVLDHTTSQASLRGGQILSQDAYGAICSVAINGSQFPIPDLAVGRLVEAPAEIAALLGSYPAATAGQLPTPSSSLVVGYDFLVDAARAIGAEFRAGIGTGAGFFHEELLAVDPDQPDTVLAPFDPRAWNAVDLRNALVQRRHDLIFLAGHYSAGNTLAADWTTELTAGEIAASRADLSNAIIIGAGCHVGYNIVDPHAVPGVTREPDWAQAFAIHRVAALIGGTGYQYGDTEFIEYNERLYLEFARRLRTGTGPVPIGKALVAAKRKYLAETPLPRDIHEKAVLQATLFGLPMLSVNYPAANRLPEPATTGLATPLAAASPTTPGAVLGLQHADLLVATDVSAELPVRLAIYPQPVPADPGDPANFVEATYVTSGPAPGQSFSNPAEPVLPVITTNVSVSGTVLRGVGFRGGHYTDRPDILPLTGAPGTEIRGVSAAFVSDVFWPVLPWSVNYFDALCGGSDAGTRLSLFPAQYRSTAPGSLTGTRRVYQDLRFRLFYSANTSTYTAGSYQSIPALAAPPVISDVQVSVSGSDVAVQAQVVGSLEAGIQEVWITYTPEGTLAGSWEPLDLTQDPGDSRVWRGTLTGVLVPETLRVLVHAVNGVGLVTTDAAQGDGYAPQNGSAAPTSLLFVGSTPGSARYGDTITVTAELQAGGSPAVGEAIEFILGSQRARQTVGLDGRATVHLSLTDLPGAYSLQASFAGKAGLLPAAVSSPFTLEAQPTDIHLTPVGTAVNRDVVAVLSDPHGRPLPERSIFFTVIDGSGVIQYSVSQITDATGQATLGAIPLDPGLAGTTYEVRAYFNGTIPLAGPAATPTRTTVLEDARYLASTAALAVTYQAQACSVVYTGEVVVPSDGTLHLEALVSSPGQDLTLALVEFTLLSSTGLPVPGGQLVVPVAADGIALGSLSGLAPDVYQVAVTVVGGSFTVLPAQQPAPISIAVYDGSAGFVTGAGWFNSPTGAYRPATGLTGKAHFGFTSKYEKKSTLPTGRTSFRFQVANLDFQSVAYQWLVVSGAKAKYKGTGALNGLSGYSFLVSALDGDLTSTEGPDRLRIKIWETTSGVVIYDNQFGASENADPSTALGGGSIIIHKP